MCVLQVKIGSSGVDSKSDDTKKEQPAEPQKEVKTVPMAPKEKSRYYISLGAILPFLSHRILVLLFGLLLISILSSVFVC